MASSSEGMEEAWWKVVVDEEGRRGWERDGWKVGKRSEGGCGGGSLGGDSLTLGSGDGSTVVGGESLTG